MGTPETGGDAQRRAMLSVLAMRALASGQRSPASGTPGVKHLSKTASSTRGTGQLLPHGDQKADGPERAESEDRKEDAAVLSPFVRGENPIRKLRTARRGRSPRPIAL